MSASLQHFTGTLVLVGAGKMGGAMLEGWLALGLDPAKVAILEPNPAPEIAALQDRGVRINPAPSSIADAAVIILAVKPQVAADVVPPLEALVRPGTVAVSVMAGKTLAFLEGALGDIAIVRSIPNTPAALGRGITVAVPNATVTAAQRTLAHTLLSGGIVTAKRQEIARARKPQRPAPKPEAPALPPGGTDRENIIAAFMALLAEHRMEEIGFADIAARAGVSLATLRGEFGSTLAILAAHSKAIDRQVLGNVDADMADEPPRERLFDVLMRRLEVM